MTKVGLTPIERIMARTVKGEDGCWRCYLSVNPTGYSCVMSLRDGRKFKQSSHRVTYEAMRGPIPPGLVIDHLCRVRNCVNPEHMEPVTSRENLARSPLKRGVALRTRICHRGHPLSGDNYGTKKSGRRFCRGCKRVENRAHRAHMRSIRREIRNP